MAFDFGFNSNKQKSSGTQTTSIDSMLRGLQEQNYTGAQGLPGSYTPVSGQQIQSQMNPYQQQVIDGLLANAGQGQRMALNLVGDRADAAHAFGGSRQGVAQGVALGQFNRDLNSQIGGLLYGGYQDAANRAQDENRYGYAYPLARQGLLNSTLAGITPNTTTNYSSKGKSSGWNFGFTGGGGGGGGGGSTDSQDTTAMVMAAMGF